MCCGNTANWSSSNVGRNDVTIRNNFTNCVRFSVRRRLGLRKQCVNCGSRSNTRNTKQICTVRRITIVSEFNQKWYPHVVRVLLKIQRTFHTKYKHRSSISQKKSNYRAVFVLQLLKHILILKFC